VKTQFLYWYIIEEERRKVKNYFLEVGKEKGAEAPFLK
jgi:hypothetical protein